MPPREITGATWLLGVIADPVSQARSPGLMNALLAERGRLGELVAVPLHVAAGELEAALAACAPRGTSPARSCRCRTSRRSAGCSTRARARPSAPAP
jgi:hypothetical protein